MAAESAVKENVIRMTTMLTAFDRPAASARRLWLLGAAIAMACVTLMASAAAAVAATEWRVTSVHGPQNMPASGGIGQYVIQPYNVGDADSTGTVTVTDTLPAGLIARDASGVGWTCTGTGTGVVRCDSADVVSAPALDVYRRGAARPIFVTVDVPNGMIGTVDNVVEIEGGGAPVRASVVDPTPFSDSPAGFGFTPGSFAGDAFDGLLPTSTPVRQAGAHPFELRVDFDVNLALGHDPDDQVFGDYYYTTPDGHVKTVETRLPPGLIGNPMATPRCDPERLTGGFGGYDKGACPPETQIGTIDLVLGAGKQRPENADVTADVPVYNMIPPPGAVAAFTFSYIGNSVWVIATVDPGDNYAIVATIKDTIELFNVRSARMALWGVPADPAHDPLRLDTSQPSHATTAMGIASRADPKPFLTLPSLCGIPGAVRVRADSWDAPGAFTPYEVGSVAAMTGCNDPRFRFEPTIRVQPVSRTAGAPTGIDVDITVPQKDDTVTTASDLYAENGRDVAIPTPPLRNATVTLPEGMVISPSSADGLAACTPLQISLDTDAAPLCPDASKLGTVRIDTPLLPDPLTGNVFLATQNDNPFGSTLAIYIVASGPGVVIKLPGEVAPDPVTGQLTATFLNNPQLPFSHLNVHFNGGPRAPLANPATCGLKSATAELTAWNLALPAAEVGDSFTIDQGCAKGFDPGFKAGTKNPSAGKSSPLITRFTRTDGDEELSTIDISLPQGVLGRIADLVLCPDVAANAGTCEDSSKIGTAVVGAGPGSNPFYITDGRVYMTGPYKGAPFGLSIVVHAQAGPLDLGTVIVRAAVFVDRQTTALRIVSDPMPTILEGIPLQVRVVDITVDRPDFTFNPTNCTEMSSSATIGSTGGRTSTKSSRFQAGNCAALPFAPKLSLTVGSRGHVHRNASTPLSATVRLPSGNANLRGVKVTLPTTINARLDVINRACTPDQFRAGDCDQAKAGTAVAVTPLLRDPLKGDVFFVKNGRPLPDMMVALKGQVDVDLGAKITIPNSKYLSTNFDTVPDVPITKFTLRLVSGKQGPVGAAANLCKKSSRRAPAKLEFTGQNGKVIRQSQRLHIAGCKSVGAKGGTAGAR